MGEYWSTGTWKGEKNWGFRGGRTIQERFEFLFSTCWLIDVFFYWFFLSVIADMNEVSIKEIFHLLFVFLLNNNISTWLSFLHQVIIEMWIQHWCQTIAMSPNVICLYWILFFKQCFLNPYLNLFSSFRFECIDWPFKEDSERPD